MTATRERYIREAMGEHVDHESWEADLCDDTPGDHKRWLLVEENRRSEPPVWLSTHDSPADAAAYHEAQEYREDWNPVRLIDLDTGTAHDIWVEVEINFTYDPAIEPEIVHPVPHPEVAEHRPCATCGQEIQPGQLYIAKAPFHIGCAPRDH